jgi:indole-3-glycerol phosphate synthase
VTILEEILEHKRAELAQAQRREAPELLARRAREVREAPRGLRDALRTGQRPRVVAELKRRSPSRGEIRADFEPVGLARAYAEGGAAALSVLTDERWFGGHLDLLEKVRRAVTLPLLRKDFVVDPYQIDEARLRGADAVLLIAAAFPGGDAASALAPLVARAASLGLDALVEIHDEQELEQALLAGADLVGINNRDLHSFEVDLGVACRLAPRVPEGVVVVAESGIHTADDVARLEAAGCHAFLVGEALMREADVAAALRRLRRRS